jgi:hypothetical protein
MANKLDDGAYVDFIDRHIEELDERIRALRNRMAAMVLEKYEIRNQEVLLGAMLETRRDLEKFRAELVQAA